ncbi:MAG: hypothetical protein PSX71_03730 [bacterium]|nr:hypothetical protein [bacterium]
MSKETTYGKYVGVAALALLLSACGGGGGTATGGPAAGTYSASSGVAQKGPLKQGSTVTAQELDSSLSPTGAQYTYQVTSDLGTFSPTSAFGSRYIDVRANGYYFDEVANGISVSTITLNGLSDLSSDTVLNVNLLTTLAYQRIKALVLNSHMTVSAARVQAESEVLAALNIRGIGNYGSFGALDLSKGTDGDKALAAVSSLFVYGNSSGQLSAMIASFQSDIADNGVIDSSVTKAALLAAGKGLNPATVAANLTSKYASLGVTYTAADISNWIDRDGDGVVGKYKYTAANVTPSTAYTSTPYVVTAVDNGATFSVTAGTLLVNGVVSGTSAIVNTGDSLTISLISGAGVAFPVSSYLNSGTKHVAKFTVGETTLALLAGGLTSGQADGQGAAAGFHRTFGMVLDAQGNLVVADQFNAVVRKITPAGMVTTLAGLAGQGGYVDAQGAAARFGMPLELAINTSGNIFVGDSEAGSNPKIRQIDSQGNVTTFYTGAGSPLGFDSNQNLYFLDSDGATYSVLKKIDSLLNVTKVAGNGYGNVDGDVSTGQFSSIAQIAVAANGDIYFADYRANTIRKITPAGVISTIAGAAGATGSTDGPGVDARFNSPSGIAIDGAGNLYVGDAGNNTVRKITPGGVVSTVVGQPYQATGDGKLELGALPGFLNYPENLLLSGNTLYIGVANAVVVVDIRSFP